MRCAQVSHRGDFSRSMETVSQYNPKDHKIRLSSAFWTRFRRELGSFFVEMNFFTEQCTIRLQKPAINRPTERRRVTAI